MGLENQTQGSDWGSTIHLNIYTFTVVQIFDCYGVKDVREEYFGFTKQTELLMYFHFWTLYTFIFIHLMLLDS